MIYIDEQVRSSLFGLGIVIRSGANPQVRFLDGRECQADGNTLRVVPGQDYDAEVRNRFEIERWLTWRVDCYANDELLPLPSPKINLAAVMERHAQTPLQPVVDSSKVGGSVLYFD